MQTLRRTGSARRISSPFSSRIRRSTPCAAGCWGLHYFQMQGLISAKIQRTQSSLCEKVSCEEQTGWNERACKMTHCRLAASACLRQNFMRTHTLELLHSVGIKWVLGLTTRRAGTLSFSMLRAQHTRIRQKTARCNASARETAPQEVRWEHTSSSAALDEWKVNGEGPGRHRLDQWKCANCHVSSKSRSIRAEISLISARNTLAIALHHRDDALDSSSHLLSGIQCFM